MRLILRKNNGQIISNFENRSFKNVFYGCLRLVFYEFQSPEGERERERESQLKITYPVMNVATRRNKIMNN
jgi:hypothetical protein